MTTSNRRSTCNDHWHNEGHSFRSVCPSCGGKGRNFPTPSNGRPS